MGGLDGTTIIDPQTMDNWDWMWDIGLPPLLPTYDDPDGIYLPANHAISTNGTSCVPGALPHGIGQL